MKNADKRTCNYFLGFKTSSTKSLRLWLLEGSINLFRITSLSKKKSRLKQKTWKFSLVSNSSPPSTQLSSPKETSNFISAVPANAPSPHRRGPHHPCCPWSPMLPTLIWNAAPTKSAFVCPVTQRNLSRLRRIKVKSRSGLIQNCHRMEAPGEMSCPRSRAKLNSGVAASWEVAQQNGKSRRSEVCRNSSLLLKFLRKFSKNCIVSWWAENCQKLSVLTWHKTWIK
jgi:hypothetical protein